MIDVIVRLLLDSKKFDSNVAGSAKKADDFNNVISSSKKEVSNFDGGLLRMAAGGLTKIAGGLGLVVGAGEAFMAVIRGSQTTSDTFDNSLNTAKDTINVFFESLSKGNFDTFKNGLSGLIDDLNELQKLRDSMGDAKLTMSFNDKKFDTQFVQYESIIRDRQKSKEDRQQAFDELYMLLNDYKSETSGSENISGAQEKVLIKTLNTRFGRDDFSLADVNDYISIYNNDFSGDPRKKVLDDYKSQMDDYQKRIKKTTTGYAGGLPVNMTTIDRAAESEFFDMQKSHPGLTKMAALSEDNDANRKAMIEDYNYILDVQKRAADYSKRMLELKNALNEGGTAATPVDKLDAGSIADLDAKIQELSAKFKNATSDAARESFNSQIKELESKKIWLEVAFKGDKLSPIVQGTGVDAKLAAPDITSNSAQKKHIGMVKDNIKANNQLADSLLNISAIMGHMSTTTNEGAAGWVAWGSNVLSAVAMALPQLAAMFGLQVSLGVAEQSKLTFPFNIVAMGATVAGVAAAVASIPKLAGGGIAYGNTLVNVGEYAGASGNPEVIAPLNKLRELMRPEASGGGAGCIEFVVSGKHLRAVLDNYDRQISKYK